MKKLIILLIASTSIASAQEVVMVSPQSVLVNGQNYGAVADTIANNPLLASKVQLALVAWATAQTAAQTAAQATVVADKAAAEAAKAKAEKDLADTRAMATKAITDTKLAITQGNWAAVQSAVDIANTPAKLRQQAEIDKQIADLTAAKAAIIAAP